MISEYNPPPSDVVKAVFERVRQRGNRRKLTNRYLDWRVQSELTIKDVILGEKNLPKFNDVEPIELEKLIIKKIKLCCVMFFFKPSSSSSEAHLSAWSGDIETEQGKEAKTALLVELKQLVMDCKKQWFSENVLIWVLYMTAVNLFRALPPTPENWDPEEGDLIKDPAWHHIQIVYEFLFYFIISQQTLPELVHKHVSESYLQNIIKLFRTNDSTERDWLKNILHRVYQRFLGFRPFIRKTIGKALWQVTYHRVPDRLYSLPSQIIEENTDDWVGELLGLWGTIVIGFSVPLHEEHKVFLRKIIIPLHKNRSVKHYHDQLSYCILHYIDKDPSLCTPVIEGLLKYWPAQSSDKELLFIQELEEILDISSRVYIVPILPELFKQIGKSIITPHFQVAERALFLWNKDVVATLTSDFRDIILPILFRAITHKHWNEQVNELNSNIVRMFQEMDVELWERTEKAHEIYHTSKIKKREERLFKWVQMQITGTDL